MKLTKCVVCDFDGVIARSLENEVEAHKLINTFHTSDTNEIASKIISYFETPKLSSKKRISNKEKEDKISFISTIFADTVLSLNNTRFEQFISLLKRLQGSTDIHIVSSGSTRFISQILSDEITLFSSILTIEDSVFKEEKINMICRKYSYSYSDITYFTDTESDILELCDILTTEHIIGCDWGCSGRERLLKHLPESQIISLNDLNNISVEIE